MTPFIEHGPRRMKVQANTLLTHPLAQSVGDKERHRWQYHFLRVTREPTPERPDSGKILVQNAATGVRTEKYALLFNVRF